MFSNVLLGHTRVRAALKILYYGFQSLRNIRKRRSMIVGRCSVCGRRSPFFYFSAGFDNYEVDPFDETGFALCCGSTNRNRALASALKTIDPDFAGLTLSEIGRERDVYIAASSGAIKDALCRSVRTVFSEYLDGVPSGQYRSGILSEDLTDLSFPDEMFDIVICEHVLEHVNNPSAAVEEVARVLRPGGAFVFTIPFESTGESRVRVTADLEEVLERKYHKDPIRDDGALVFTDFAREDVVERYLVPAGLAGTIELVDDRSIGVLQSPVVIATKRVPAPQRSGVLH